jgi:chemotaxis protein histidine kinase CheA
LPDEKDLMKSFAEEAHRRCAAITAQLTMIEMGQGPPAGLADVRAEAHTLKGTAAVLGLQEVSDRAAHLEQWLIDASTTETLDPALAGQIQDAVVAIEAGARSAAGESDPAA